MHCNVCCGCEGAGKMLAFLWWRREIEEIGFDIGSEFKRLIFSQGYNYSFRKAIPLIYCITQNKNSANT